jgi:hypothetical protein
LIDQDGPYAKLYALQFASDNNKTAVVP